MNTAQIKSDLYQKIDILPPRQVKELYAIFQDYLNKEDDVEEWADLSVEQQEKIMTGIRQANANKVTPVAQVTKGLRKKYGLND